MVRAARVAIGPTLSWIRVVYEVDRKRWCQATPGNQRPQTIGFLVFMPDAVDSNPPLGVYQWAHCRVYEDEQEARDVVLNLQKVVPMSQQIRKTIARRWA